MRKTITKYYDTLRQAERYHTMLSNKYERVELVRSPCFTEAGVYQWIVNQ